jgi:hypothetical protein
MPSYYVSFPASNLSNLDKLAGVRPGCWHRSRVNMRETPERHGRIIEIFASNDPKIYKAQFQVQKISVTCQDLPSQPWHFGPWPGHCGRGCAGAVWWYFLDFCIAQERFSEVKSESKNLGKIYISIQFPFFGRGPLLK